MRYWPRKQDVVVWSDTEGMQYIWIFSTTCHCSGKRCSYSYKGFSCTAPSPQSSYWANIIKYEFPVFCRGTGHRSAHHPSPFINKRWTRSKERKEDLPGLWLSKGNSGCPGKSLRTGQDTSPEHIRQRVACSSAQEPPQRRQYILYLTSSKGEHSTYS